MTDKTSSSIEPRLTENFSNKFRAAAIKLAITTVVLGCIVVIGWLGDIAPLKSVISGLGTMKMTTAIGFILGGFSLLVWHWQQALLVKQTVSKTNLLSAYLYCVSSVVIIFCLVTLVEYGFQLNLGTDLLSFPNLDAVDAVVRGRMSPNTALNFFWFNLAILFLVRQYYFAVQLLAIAIVAVALMVGSGYLYDIALLYGLNSGTGMAIHTAIGFVLLAIALLGTRADKGWIKVISENAPGGIMARWLLPLVLILPLVLSLFFGHIFPSITDNLNFKLALRTIVETAISGGIVWWTAKKLNEIDRQKQKYSLKLKASEQQLRLAFDYAAIGKALVSSEGRFLKVNPALCELLGYRESELLQKTFQDITHPEDLDADLEFVRQLLADEIGTYQIEKRYVRKSGHLVWTQLNVSLVSDETARPLYFVSQIQDISGRKQAESALQQLNEELEERVKQRTAELSAINQSLKLEIKRRRQIESALKQSQARLQAILDNAPSVIYLKEPGGELQLVNREFETIFGLSQAEVIGKSDREIFPPEIAAALNLNDRRVVETRQPLQTEEVVPQADGKLHTYLSIKFPLFDSEGRVTQIGGVATDITLRKEAEVLLQQVNDKLEQKVKERTVELKSANASLESEIAERRESERKLQQLALQLKTSNQALQDFAYVASHDLQEPLRKIQAFGDRLEAKYSQELEEKGKDYLRRMQNAARRMQNLIRDLLTYSRITTKSQPFVATDLNVIVRDVLSDLETRIEQTKGQVVVEKLPTIEADPLQMRQLWQNLIGNSLKFHLPEVPPTVTVLQVSFSESSVEVRVKDNGIGFDEKYLDRIFTPFQRLHGRLEYEGTGMGLAICRKIVERHSGKLQAKSLPGKGATFIITLPVTQPNNDK